MAVNPIYRPKATLRLPTLKPDYSVLDTMEVLDLREALDRARRREGHWELVCTHVAMHHGMSHRDTIRLVGDNRQSEQWRGVLLEINGTPYGHPTFRDGEGKPVTRCTNRHHAYLILTQKFPDCMQREWQWAFVSFPSWKESRA